MTYSEEEIQKYVNIHLMALSTIQYFKTLFL